MIVELPQAEEGVTNLLPCPFCGIDGPQWCDENGGDWHFIQCRNCESVTGHFYKSCEEAIVAWNTRAGEK